MKNSSIVIGIVTLVIGTLAGCTPAPGTPGGTSSSSSSDTTSSVMMENSSSSMAMSSEMGTSSSEQTSSVEAKSASMNIEGMQFSLPTLTIKKNTRVTWTNKDSVGHTVTGDDGKGPTSSTLSSGETYSYYFDTVGIYPYHCAIHPNMKGTVIVME